MFAPTCRCCKQEQRWNKDSRYKAGGFWRCRKEDPVKLYLRHQRQTTKRKEQSVSKHQNKA